MSGCGVCGGVCMAMPRPPVPRPRVRVPVTGVSWAEPLLVWDLWLLVSLQQVWGLSLPVWPQQVWTPLVWMRQVLVRASQVSAWGWAQPARQTRVSGRP